MQAAVDAWITPAATAEFQLQAGEAANTCTLHATPPAAAAGAAAAGVSAAMPLGAMPPPAPSAAAAAKGAAAGLQDRLLPMQPVERQGSLADLLFEILDDGDTDDLLLADLNKSSKAAAAAQQQLRAQLNAGSQMQQQQPPLLQQLQQRKLLERLQANKPGDAADMFAMREQLSNGTSSSLAASQTGAGASPWPSFTSAAGQAGPGAAALFGGSTPDAAQAAAAQDASTALLQQLQLRGQQGGPASSLPALKAAAGVAESALLQRQAMKQQQQQGTGDTPMPAAADTAQQQQPQQQGDALPAEQAAAAAAPAAAAVDAVGGNCSAATAAALLAEGGDDLSLDLDFLESMLQGTNTGDFKVLGDLARMVSLPVGMNSPLVGLQQQQQQQQPAAAAAAGSGPSSLAADMNQAALMQQQGLGDLGSTTALQPMDLSAAAAAAAGVSAFSGAAAAGGAFPMVPGPGPAGAGCLPDAAPSMDSGIRSTMNHLGRLQIPSPVGDLGLAGSLQAPMSVDAARPGADQGLAAARGGNMQQMLVQQQGQAAGGMAAGASGKPPLPACSSRSGVGPSNSVPEESDGSVEVDTAEAMSDGEVEQAAGGRRTSARRRSRLALAKHKKQQQKAQQAADAAAAAQAGAAAAAAAAGPQGGAAAPDAAAQSQPQVVPGGMLQLLLNGSSSASMGPSPAGVSAQMQQLDIMQQQPPQQQHQQLLMQSYGSAPNLGFEGPLSPAMLGTAASTGQIGLHGPASGGLDLATIPRKQLTAVLATLAPNALQQLLQLQQRQPALARVVLKRALQQLQQQQELGIQHQGLESLLGGLGQMDGLGMGPAGAATPTASGAAGGMPSGLNQRPPSDPQGRRNKAPLVFYRQRGSKAMTNMGGKPTSQQAQRAGSAPVGDGKDHLMSPQAAAAAAAAGGLDPAMAAAMCGGAGPAPSAAAAAGEGGQHGSLSSSDMASSDGAPPHPHAQQQPSSSSRRLGKRGRQITQNDLSGAVAAAAAAAGGSNNPLDPSAGVLPTAQSSRALPYLPGGQQGLQMQMQHGGMPDGMQQLGGVGLEDPAARAEQRGQVSGLSALFRQPGGSTATASTGSAGGSADAAVITQQARALVRILTKLNTAQLVQTRTMLHSVLQRSAPGLLDHMGAIERMITQLINLKQSQPSLPQQQQQQLLMQGAFGPGGSMFAAGGGGGMGMNMNAGCGLDDTLMAQQQQQQQQGQMQAAGMLQQQQQQQHMMSWANDPFVQHQLQQPQGQAQRQQQQQLLQAQMQAQQQQQQSPWGIASSLSGPQPLQWNAQQSMVQPDPAAAAAGAEGGVVGTEFDADQSPYQLATRRQQGRRTKAKPDKQQAQQQQAAAASGLQMAASAPVGLHAQASPVGAVDARGRGMAMNQQQQQQQMGMLAELQQQQRMQQMQLQQGLMMGGSLASQQQQQAAAAAGQLQMQVPRDPLAGAGAGDGLLLDAAQERQQEDMLLSWLQNDALEDWPEGKDVMGVLS